MTHINGLNLKEWTQEVDRIVYERYDLGVYCILGDFMSYDLWSDGLSPSEAVAELEDDINERLGELEEMAAIMGVS